MSYWEHDDAVRSMNARARIKKVDDTGTQQLVDLYVRKNEEPVEVFRPQPHGFTSNPPKDSEGFVVPMGGRGDRMLYQEGGHKKYRPRNLPEGAVALYNHSGDIVKIVEASADFVHSKKINLKIGKGQDVSSDSGSKPPSGPDAKEISVVLTGSSMVLTYGNTKITMEDGKITHEAPKVVVLCPDIHLGEDGGKRLKLIDDTPTTKVWAI